MGFGQSLEIVRNRDTHEHRIRERTVIGFEHNHHSPFRFTLGRNIYGEGFEESTVGFHSDFLG